MSLCTALWRCYIVIVGKAVTPIHPLSAVTPCFTLFLRLSTMYCTALHRNVKYSIVMSLYPLLYCSYIVISGSELLLQRYIRFGTTPTSLYSVLYCFYIVISGNILPLHRYIRWYTAPTSLYPVLYCTYLTFFTVTSLHYIPVALYILCAL
jgi:hypothetical protein